MRFRTRVAAPLLVLAAIVPIVARGQFAARYPSVSQLGAGYGGNVAYPSFGYGIRNGQIGAGYGGVYTPYRRPYVPPARTTISLQPLYSAITSLPGWDGPTGRVPRRVRHVRRLSDDPPVPHYDRDGNIFWPGVIADDPSSTALRKEADAAFRVVVRESKSTGHASIRPVIAAKQKLSAYERKILPAIKGRSVPDGDALEAFFVDLNRSLDAMNSVY